jgi:excisionase family DNA binding protein
MLMTIGEVARLLKLKPQTIYRWVQQKKLPGAKIGKEWRFRRSAIERWLDRYMKQQEEAAERDGAGGEAAAAGERGAKKRPGKKKVAGPEKN